MVTRYFTQSGSIYEVDEERKRVRRFGADTTTRAHADWTPYKFINTNGIGSPLLIHWPKNVPLLPGSPDGMTPATLSTTIVRVEVGRDAT